MCDLLAVASAAVLEANRSRVSFIDRLLRMSLSARLCTGIPLQLFAPTESSMEKRPSTAVQYAIGIRQYRGQQCCRILSTG